MRKVLSVLMLVGVLTSCQPAPQDEQHSAQDKKPYLDIQDVTTAQGLRVWYVQDDTIPAWTLRFSVNGGASFDPVGQEGMAELLSTLLDEGAGTRDAEAFQDALDQYGVRLGFSAGRDRFSGSLTTTVAHQDVAVELLSDALNKPHFDDGAIARMKQALASSIRFNQMNPQFLAGRRLMETLFEGQLYARPVGGTEASLEKITRQDIVQYHRDVLCKDGLKIAVVGDVQQDDLVAMIDAVFGGLSSCEARPKIDEMVFTNQGAIVTVPRAGAQSVVLMAQKAVARQDKDWWAVRILDFALGGGQFSSRLMDEVRVKRGLTYGVSSGVVSYEYAPLWMIQSGVAPENTDKAISLIKSIWADVAENGLTETEIKAAKDYLIGSMPLALTSTGQIASILLQMQEDDLPQDTLDRRAQEISSVTADDIRRVAREVLDVNKMVTVIVGPEAEDKMEDHIDGKSEVTP